MGASAQNQSDSVAAAQVSIPAASTILSIKSNRCGSAAAISDPHPRHATRLISGCCGCLA
jgi:hypothetical protein